MIESYKHTYTIHPIKWQQRCLIKAEKGGDGTSFNGIKFPRAPERVNRTINICQKSPDTVLHPSSHFTPFRLHFYVSNVACWTFSHFEFRPNIASFDADSLSLFSPRCFEICQSGKKRKLNFLNLCENSVTHIHDHFHLAEFYLKNICMHTLVQCWSQWI